MPFSAWGVSYPRIDLRHRAAEIWYTDHTYTFDSDDNVKLTPIDPIEDLEAVIQLEDGTIRKFVRGYRLSWMLDCYCWKDNTLAQFIYDHLLNWLNQTTYDEYQIRLYPHYDLPARYFSVYIKNWDQKYIENRWPLGIEVSLIIESLDLEDEPPYYTT